MAYSPTGKALAFTTMEPYDQGEDPLVAGKHVYRLMVLHGRNDLRVLAESSHDMLSAPAFSPDGRHIAYPSDPPFLPRRPGAAHQGRAATGAATRRTRADHLDPSSDGWRQKQADHGSRGIG